MLKLNILLKGLKIKRIVQDFNIVILKSVFVNLFLLFIYSWIYWKLYVVQKILNKN